MGLYEKILVITDFNDFSLNVCLKFSKYLFNDNSEVELLHVIEESGFISKLFSSRDEDLENCVKARLPLVGKNISEIYGVDIKTNLRKGRITKEINDFCQENAIDLVIMATANVSDKSIGANTHRLIRTATVPLLVLSVDLDPRPIRNILIPIELYLSSRQKVADAVAWAKHFGARITIISGVWDSDKETKFKVKQISNNTKEFIESKGIECELVMLDGLETGKDFAEETVEYMNNPKNEVDIVMVMGRDESTEFSIDSRSQDVVRYAKIPVLCVPLRKTGMNARFL
ncbi:MAG TPA: universal stress protein [Candidatus Onthomorpha intestinigallinarum]|uniref:Universal stress protein n=1 Tax=Candidatus Onthomorpha intestinigallinarum TaxID=2840880 RepID=A0A9D1UHI5_9BACT|nr:universal stress protein [Candidatus Onthomorpha intestinigallinarum]